MNQSVPGVRASWIAMIWSNFVAGSALSAIAARGVTRSARERMSATMISLPSPFILAKGARAIGQNPSRLGAIWRKRRANYQCGRLRLR